MKGWWAGMRFTSHGCSVEKDMASRTEDPSFLLRFLPFDRITHATRVALKPHAAVGTTREIKADCFDYLRSSALTARGAAVRDTFRI